MRLLNPLALLRTPNPSPPRLRYEERAKLAKCPLAAQCLELMARKKSNLSVGAALGL